MTGKGRAAARREALEEAARIADAFEQENFAMCTDSILLDPVLSKFGRRNGHTITAEDWESSESHQVDGTIHSAMAHAARNIAAAIRRFATSPGEG